MAIRGFRSRGMLRFGVGMAALALAASGTVVAQEGSTATQLDTVVAVVNNQVILASDLSFEMRMYKLLPIGTREDATPVRALERLTTRALIVQQILQEDPQGMEVSQRDLETSLAELRQNLPGCKERDCNSEPGWAAYLATLNLTPEPVSVYWTRRIAVLRFIEQRFRSGIRIAPEEIETYYRETLTPLYAKAADVPPLERISPRIQEILLQQKVNALLNDWLKSLKDQGQVEILDPALAAAGTTIAASLVPAAPVLKPAKGATH